MAESFLKRLLTRKNLVLGSQLAGLALAFSSKKFRGTAAEAVKTAGAALKGGEAKVDLAKKATTAAKPSVKRAVKAASDATPEPVKRAARKAVNGAPAPVKEAVKRVAKVTTEAAAVADAAPKPRGRPKSATPPVAPRKRRGPAAKLPGGRRPRTPEA